jgi:hypothetical protein
LRQSAALHLQAEAKRRGAPAISAIVRAAGSEKLARVCEEDARDLRIELEIIDRRLDEDERYVGYDIDRYARIGTEIVQEALAHAIRPFAERGRGWSTF